MEYTVQKLARLAGVSPRTLRYYDEIGLLRPARISSSGYRIYGQSQVDALQQILLYREMELPLEEIASLLGNPEFDRLAALRGHRHRLLEKRARLDLLLKNVEDTIHATEGGMTMKNEQKFQGFKQALVEENEEKYGAEIREKYGAEAVDSSNRKLMGMTKERYEEMERTGAEVLNLLDAAYSGGDPGGATARQLAEAHKRWLGFTWQ